MNKKDLSERDIYTKLINPAIEKAVWHMKRQACEFKMAFN
jgi:type I restriction enzyme R subunit